MKRGEEKRTQQYLHCATDTTVKGEEKKNEKKKGKTNATTVSLLYYVNSQLHEVVTRLCSRYCKGRVLQGSSEYIATASCYCYLLCPKLMTICGAVWLLPGCVWPCAGVDVVWLLLSSFALFRRSRRFCFLSVGADYQLWVVGCSWSAEGRSW